MFDDELDDLEGFEDGVFCPNCEDVGCAYCDGELDDLAFEDDELADADYDQFAYYDEPDELPW